MTRTALFLLAFVLLVACRPISRGPNPYAPASPLAMLSPLYSRGEAPAIGQERMLIAPLDELRAGTIPAASLPALRRFVYLPMVAHQKRYPCGMVPMAAELLRLMIEDAEQMRQNPRCNNAMVAIAQNRANDMTRRKYFSHTDPDGYTPNRYLKIAGCLPDGYPENGNTVESITLNYRTPQTAWKALKQSPGHRPHVLGTHPFWEKQGLIGVGWSGNDWGEVFVVMTTEGCK